MEAIHGVLAWAVVAAVVAGIGSSAYAVASRRDAGPAFERFQAAVVALLVVAAASGAVMLISGAGPRDGLHLLYAVVAIALIPLARSFTGRARTLPVLVAFVFLGAIVYRLFTTG